MRAFGYRVVDLLADHFEKGGDGPVGAKVVAGKTWDEFAGLPAEHPGDPHALLTRLEREVLPNNLHLDHPRFFAFVPAPNNFISVMADALGKRRAKSLTQKSMIARAA